jgi:hypothetical protein
MATEEIVLVRPGRHRPRSVSNVFSNQPNSRNRPAAWALQREPKPEGPVMTHQPPIPEAAQSPYPLHPAPMAERSEAEEAVESSAGGGDEGEEAGGLAGWASENRAGLGAALGIGSAALVAALLYTRYNRREARDRRAGAARRGMGSSQAA